MKFFEAGNFEEAIDEYLPLYEADKENLEYQLQFSSKLFEYEYR